MTPDQLSALSQTPPANGILPGSLPHSPIPGTVPAATEIDNQLKALADIHLPEQVSFWPPAPGWWIVVIISIISIVLLYKIISKKIHRDKYKKQAKQELETISRFWEKQQNLIATASRLSILMRRIALTDLAINDKSQSARRTEIASLSEQQWLLYLDQQPGLAQCSKLYNEILLQLPYQDPMLQFDISEQKQLGKKMDELLTGVNIWIKKGFKHV